MEQPNELVRRGSSSSSITVPWRTSSGGTTSSRREIEEEEESLPTTTNQLVVVWKSIVAFCKSITSYLYQSTVAFVAGFFADVLSNPKLQTVVVDLIVAAINAFMDQDDIGDKFDDTARRVIYDTEKARETSHALGKEVVPVVTGFIGGVASSFKPSEFKKRRVRRKERQSSRHISDEFVSELTTNSEGFSSAGATGVLTFDGKDVDEEIKDCRETWHSRSKKTK